MIQKLRILLLITFIFLAGCTKEYSDVSDKQQYKHLLNNIYALTTEMHISGVNLPSGYGKEINIYLIERTSPSWSGPELISRDVLKINTMLKVKSIRECTNCYFDEDIDAIVTFRPFKKSANAPIAIGIGYLDSETYVRKIN